MGILFSMIGIVFFIVGILILQKEKQKEKNCTAKTYGKIVDIVRHSKKNLQDDTNAMEYPVVEYQVGEEKIRKESAYGKSKTSYMVGQAVEVYYNPQNNCEYYIGGETLRQTLGFIFTIAGAGVFVLGIFVLIIA